MRISILWWSFISASLVMAQHLGHEQAVNGSSSGAAQQTLETVPSVHKGKAPTPVFDTNGVLWVAFVQGSHLYVSKSKDLGKSFEAPICVNPQPETIRCNGESRPAILVNREGHVFVCYTKALPVQWSGDLMFSRSLDGGKTFSLPQKLNDDQDVSGHAFAVMGINRENHLYIAWIDGRDRVAAEKAGTEFVGSSIYATVSFDGGQSFEPNFRWVAGSCQCCRLAMDFNQKGHPILFWRHIFDDQIRDHAFGSWEKEKGFVMSRATWDYWRVDGCPHHGPAITSSGSEHTYLAWFTVKSNQRHLYVGKLEDGATLIPGPVPVPGIQPAHPAILAKGPSVFLIYQDAGYQGTTALKLMQSHNAGDSWSQPIILLQVQGFLSDHPALLTFGEDIFAAWQAGEQFNVLPLEIQSPEAP